MVSRGCKRTHTLIVKSRAWSSRCCGLAFVALLWHWGWVGKYSKMLATIKLLHNPRANKVFTHSLIIFSGNGQTKNNENFQYGSETLPIVDKQTYLGIEMTSSGRYTYARDILSKKAYKVLATVKRLFSNSDTTTITIKNKLFDALVKPILLYGCEIWGPELLSYKTHFDKSTIEQVHIKFCKQTLNTPWYTENIACRAELGRYPLSIDIKASIFSYWLRLQHGTVNPLLKEAFHHARNHSQFFDVLNNDETIRMHSTSNTSSQQPVKNARSSIKKQLKKDYIRNWLKARNNTSECSERNLHIKKSNTTTNWKTISELSETQHIE